MEIKYSDRDLQFLAGDGEMSKLTREKNWNETSLGPPELWPQSLRTSLSIILNSRFPMFLFWGKELICFYNDAYRPSLGNEGKHPYILGMKGEDAWAEIWHIIKPLIDQVLSGGNATWSEDQLIPIFRNGKIEDVYWTFSYSPVNDESGKPAGVFVVCSETTEKVITYKKVEESEQKYRELSALLEEKVKERTEELQKTNEVLRASEERYHRMVEDVQDYAIILLSKEGIILNWNKGAENIKGYKAGEIVGKSFSIFYTDADKSNHIPEKLLALAANKGKATDENWRVRKDGSRFWGSVIITALRDDKRNIVGFVKVTRDLTERKNAEDSLKQKNVDLEKMNKELQSFAYISSHDLQEPLRKIQTFAARLTTTEFKNLTEGGKDMFQRMQSSAMRMQRLIDDLLSYSRTNTSDRILEKTDLNKIVEEVKADLKDELKQKNATVETSGLCEVSIIPFQFRQLLHNLFVNSIKFSTPERPLQIKIKCDVDKGSAFKNDKLSQEKIYCHISFSDNGIGFEQQYSDKIFELFQRLHGRSAYDGTGIGLAIVKKIVDNHDGVITATSEINKGAAFDIYIPV